MRKTKEMMDATHKRHGESFSAPRQPSADEQQSGFERWLRRTSPSGDCDSVHSQWLESSDYLDLFEDQ